MLLRGLQTDGLQEAQNFEWIILLDELQEVFETYKLVFIHRFKLIKCSCFQNAEEFFFVFQDFLKSLASSSQPKLKYLKY